MGGGGGGTSYIVIVILIAHDAASVEPRRYRNSFDTLRYQNCVRYSVLDNCVASKVCI